MERLTAREVLFEFNKTQHATFFLTAETSDGELRDVVVKPGMAVDRHFCEWVAAELARALKIQVPRSYCVDIDSDFVAGLL